MRKRLRKKLCLKEFQQLGFNIDGTFKHNLTQEEQDKFYTFFIAEIIDKNNLEVGGGFYENEFLVYAVDAKYKNKTAEKREIIRAELEKNKLIKDYKLGQLKDVWYDKSYKG